MNGQFHLGRVDLLVGDNTLVGFVGDERVVTRVNNQPFVLQTDNIGHIALVFNAMVSFQSDLEREAS
jgi:hypothetical protein